MTSEADAVVLTVLKAFDELPGKRKPRARENGTREWVPLSGIVAQHGDGSLTCVALATGMKCIPTTKLPTAHGNVLHDWHAEVLCMRAFNHFLLTECKALLTGASRTSPYLCLVPTTATAADAHPCPFAWRNDVTLHMYCSEAPCGDASMELTIAAQGPNAAPWSAPLSKSMMERHGLLPTTTTSTSSSSTAPPRNDAAHARTPPAPPPAPQLLGRACFSRLGVVRRKPARPDAPPSLSKSCSDKLAARQCTSLLGAVAALLVAPAPALYLASLVLPAGQCAPAAAARCFAPRGRMAALAGAAWRGGYAFRPLAVRTTALEFGFSRRAPGGAPARCVASNLAAAWTVNGLSESVVNGVLQGRRVTDPRCGSAVSRRNLWTLAHAVAGLAAPDGTGLGYGTYAELKATEMLADRRQVKQDIRADALRGWVRNVGDENFGLGS